MPSSTVKNIVSEFIGTFILVFTVGCNIAAKNEVWGATSIAASLMVCIYALGSVSGAHFNPAVTVACWLSGALGAEGGASKAATYIVTQLIAGCVAGVSYGALYGVANLEPVGDYKWPEVMAIEVFYTFMLCFVVLRAAVSTMNPPSNEYFGLAIGFVIIAGGYAGGKVSGGCFNPAVAFGIDVPSAGLGFGWSFLYTLFELIGAVLAVGAHSLVDVPPPRSGEPKLTETGRQFVSEFIGTFFLVLTVGLNVLHQSSAGALSIAASLMVMIYALGGVSGGHFNPAVTATLVMCKKAEASIIPLYWSAQLLGGIIAALTYSGVVGRAMPLAHGKGYTNGDVAVAEIVFTFLLCTAVLHTAALTDTKDMLAGGKAKQVYGLAIAFSIVAGGNAIGAVSMGSLNPAVSFGVDTAYATKGGSFGNCLIYSVYEFVGAMIAAAVFYVVREEEFKSQPLLDSKQVSYGGVN